MAGAVVIVANSDSKLTSARHEASSRLVNSTETSAVTSYTFDPNGNQTVVTPPTGNPVTMAYDKENRLSTHKDASVLTTYTYSGDGLKRTEATGGGLTTLVWDGSDYLQGRS